MPPIVLKWSGSIASRGKYRGKTAPTLDDCNGAGVIVKRSVKNKKKLNVKFIDNEELISQKTNRMINKAIKQSNNVDILMKWDNDKTNNNFQVINDRNVGNINDESQDLTLIMNNIPKPLINSFDLQFTKFSYFVSNIYATNISSSCSNLLTKLLEVSSKNDNITQLMNHLCDSLTTPDNDNNTNTESQVILEDTSLVQKAPDSSESFFASTLLNHFITVAKYGTNEMSKEIEIINKNYNLKGGIYLIIENPELSIWIKLNCWYDCLHSLMIGRMPFFSKFDKDFLFDEELMNKDGHSSLKNHDDHNSDLFAVIGCTDLIASKLLDISYIVGSYGFEAFDNSLNIDLNHWNELEKILLFLHSFQIDSISRNFKKKETEKCFKNRLLLYDIWRWAALLYIYTVCYRKTSNDSFMVKNIRDKILYKFAQFSEPMASKQALWSFFLACCDISKNEIELHIWSLNLLENWYINTKLGCFKTHVDILLEIWNQNKESEGKTKWWEVLGNKYKRGDGELIFS